MATIIWKGGASTVAGVNTTVFAGGTWSGDGVIRFRMTDEAGNNQDSSLTTTIVTSEAQRDLMLTQLQAVTQSLFTAITWTASGTDTILATAKVPGIPFILVASESNDDTNGTITHVSNGDTASVLSEGPEDFLVDGSGNYTNSNWVTTEDAVSVKPPAASDVLFNQGTWSVRYSLQTGLNQNSIRMSPRWTGTYGDPVGGFYLDMDATNAGDKVMFIDKTQGDVWATVECDNVFIVSTAPGANAVRFGAASNIGDDGNVGIGGIVCHGPGVRGTVQILSGATLYNWRVGGDTSGTYICGAVVAPYNFECGSGLMDLNLGTVGINRDAVSAIAPGGVLVYGSGTVRHFGLNAEDTIAKWVQIGGRGEPNGPCGILLLDVRGGIVSFENNRSAVTVTLTELYGGQIIEGGGAAVTFTAFNQHGGSSSVSATINDNQNQAI